MLNMTKGATNALTIATTSKIAVGVEWDESGGGKKGLLGAWKKRQGQDLDLSAVAFVNDGEVRPVRMAWFESLDPLKNGSLLHTGDARNGRAEGDDELIELKPHDLPPELNLVGFVFVLSAYKRGVSFANVENVTMNVYVDGSKIAAFMPTISSARSGAVMAKVWRDGAEWTLTVINEVGNATSKDEILALAARYV